MAEGGLVSAQAGRMFTTNGPQLVLAGDNPGGRETTAFIPHDNPGPILRSIDKMFGRQGQGGGNGGGGGNNIFIEIHQHEENGNEKIRRFTAAQGGNRYRFGA